MIREINVKEITKNIKEMCIEANYTLSPDMDKAMKKAAEEEAKNTVFDAEDKAKKEAQSIAKDGEVNVASLKEKAMANVDDAASIIVKNVL